MPGWYAALPAFFATGILTDAASLLVGFKHHLVIELGLAEVTGGTEELAVVIGGGATKRFRYDMVYLDGAVVTFRILTAVACSLPDSLLNTLRELTPGFHPFRAATV